MGFQVSQTCYFGFVGFLAPKSITTDPIGSKSVIELAVIATKPNIWGEPWASAPQPTDRGQKDGDRPNGNETFN